MHLIKVYCFLAVVFFQDKPVGNGTGMHNNEQLFVTKPNYASLIPVVGLLKAEVVYGSRELVPPPPNASRGNCPSDSLGLGAFLCHVPGMICL